MSGKRKSRGSDDEDRDKRNVSRSDDNSALSIGGLSGMSDSAPDSTSNLTLNLNASKSSRIAKTRFTDPPQSSSQNPNEWRNTVSPSTTEPRVEGVASPRPTPSTTGPYPVYPDILSPCPTPGSPRSPTVTDNPDARPRGVVSGMKTARPYRSHKYPACTRCHKRRSRCTIEVPGQPCLLCRMHNAPCSSATAKPDERIAPKVGFIHRSLLPESGYMDDGSHVVGPVIARDTQAMDRYLAPISSDVNAPGNATHGAGTGGSFSISQTPNKPIYQTSSSQRPNPPSPCTCSRNLPLELLERVDPYFEKLVGLYFEHLYPAFPVLEEECIVDRLGQRWSMPHTFLVNFIAHAVFYWNLAPELLPYVRPEQDFSWQVADTANMSDMHKGDVATVTAIVLNVAGRPSKAYMSNVASVARVVALSNSIGLNHDSREWKISDAEKRLRWKAWWAVLIHDRWFNFAQGTPPTINKAHYDVRLPTVEMLAADRANIIKHRQAAQCYIELCKLTEIVGDVLPLIYHIRSNGTVKEQTTRSGVELFRWCKGGPNWLKHEDFDNRPAVPGLPNLQLSYLSAEMLLRRLAWHEVCQQTADPGSEWLLRCLESAEKITRFAMSLRDYELAGFWLPYNAHHFTSAVTLLLRCGVQTSDYQVRQQAMGSARMLVQCLRRFKEDFRWDMAEMAFTESETVLRRIEDALPKMQIPVQQTAQPSPFTQSVDDTFWEHPALQHQGFGWNGQPEDLFPDVFSEFNADSSLFDTQTGANFG